MKKIAYFLRIFEKKQYLEDFLDGKIYLNRLSYFRKVEDYSDNNRADPKEGINAWWQPSECKLEINGQTITDFAAPIEVRLDENDHLHVFCLLAGATDVDNLSNPSKLSTLQRDFSVPHKCAELGAYYALVHNSAEFINRMVNTVQDLGYKGNAGLVNYYDPDIFSGNFDGVKAVFNKHLQYKHQKEYRFAINTFTEGEDPLIINIGDIRDIVTISKTWDIKLDITFNAQ